MEDDNLNFNVKFDQDTTTNSKQKTSIKSDQPIQDLDQEQKTLTQNKVETKPQLHPIICMLVMGFKAFGILTYLLLNLFIGNATLTFIIVIIFNSIDFWFMKNIAGRLLVGLRWWEEVDANTGLDIWRFESPDQTRKTNSVDSSVFWFSQIISLSIWCFFLVVKFLSLDVYWLICVIITICLQGSNFVFYIKCSREHSKKMNQMKDSIAKKGLSFMSNIFFKSAFGGNNQSNSLI
eukprot:TRINITY_DN23484_c0_g1_i1.p1 TRINITY_DN23484_c0_g1~~TRINITY_DN23484_c0_g1_i1.p1  ORF type:complete len:235 (-),score=25.87 TRINITY_DN23484_c0_g1_i1:69-773(-)